MNVLLKIPETKRLRYAMIFVFALTCAVYWHVLTDAFVRWDDGMLIYENPAVRGITPHTLLWVFTHYDPELYIPLTFITYQINYLIGGTSPFFYHLTNLLLHALNAALVVWLIEKLSGKMRLALLCGLLFAVHPLNTEAVAWASGRKDVLSGAFFLGAWIAYLSFEETDSKRAYRTSIGLFFAGLLSKVMAATLPAAVFLQNVTRDARSWLETLKKLWPHIVLSLLFIMIALFGKRELVVETTALQKALMACLSTVFYVKQLLWPTHLSLLYPYLGTITIASPDFYVPLILVLIGAVISVLCWKKWPFVPFCLFGYVATLAPTFVNFSKGGDLDIYFASDRYAYIPSLFLFLLFAIVLDLVTTKFLKKHALAVFLFVTMVLTSVLSIMAFRQSLVWSDTQSLFEHVIDVYPDASHVAYNNLGNMERLQGDLPAAIADFKKALAIKEHPKTWANLGAVYRLQGDLKDANDAYAKALEIDPNSAYAHFGLALVEMQEGEKDKAEKEYRLALELDPTIGDVYVNLGALLVSEGKLDDGIALYKQAVAINPDLAQGYYDMGVAQMTKGDLTDAELSFRQALDTDPGLIPAHINLGLLLAKQGDRAGSLAQFEDILKIDPKNKTALSAVQQLSGQ